MQVVKQPRHVHHRAAFAGGDRPNLAVVCRHESLRGRERRGTPKLARLELQTVHGHERRDLAAGLERLVRGIDGARRRRLKEGQAGHVGQRHDAELADRGVRRHEGAQPPHELRIGLAEHLRCGRTVAGDDVQGGQKVVGADEQHHPPRLLGALLDGLQDGGVAQHAAAKAPTRRVVAAPALRLYEHFVRSLSGHRPDDAVVAVADPALAGEKRRQRTPRITQPTDAESMQGQAQVIHWIGWGEIQ